MDLKQHTVTAGVRLLKALSGKCCRGAGAGLTALVGSWHSCSVFAFHLFTFAWSQQDLVAMRALATGGC